MANHSGHRSNLEPLLVGIPKPSTTEVWTESTTSKYMGATVDGTVYESTGLSTFPPRLTADTCRVNRRRQQRGCRYPAALN